MFRLMYPLIVHSVFTEAVEETHLDELMPLLKVRLGYMRNM